MNFTPWLNDVHQKRFRILVIDDLAENIALINNILKDEYDITVATSAALGLELAKKEPLVDLILLDIVMPNMDGYELCALLKANTQTKDIPVIFLTVLDETANIEKGFIAGGVDYVTKPFEPAILKARVRTHCELSSQKRELRRFNQSLEMVVLERTRELEQAQLYNERLAHQAALGDIISMIAHQWRQPISTIAMIVNKVLLDIALGKVDTHVLKHEMENINKQTHYLANTIENFRNFFKPNQAKQTIELKVFFEALKDLLQAVLSHHAITLVINIENVERITVYKNELLQVLINLINNAKDAIVSQALHQGIISVNVFAYEKEKKVIFEIHDNAGGIPLEIIDKIGTQYFTTKTEKEGTGLGIYMSKMILEKHLQGTLSWSNKDEGASFYVQIPYD